MTEDKSTSESPFKSRFRANLVTSCVVGILLGGTLFLICDAAFAPGEILRQYLIEHPIYTMSDLHQGDLKTGLPLHLYNVYDYLSSPITLLIFLGIAILAYCSVYTRNSLDNSSAMYTTWHSVSMMILRFLQFLFATAAFLLLIITIYSMSSSLTLIHPFLDPYQIAIPGVVINFCVFVLLTVTTALVCAASYDPTASTRETSAYLARIRKVYPEATTTKHLQVGKTIGQTLAVFSKTYLLLLSLLSAIVIVEFVIYLNDPFGAIILCVLIAIYMWLVFGFSTSRIQGKYPLWTPILSGLNIFTALTMTIVLIVSVLAQILDLNPNSAIKTGITCLPFLYIYCIQISTLWFTHTDKDSGLPPKVFFPQTYAISFVPDEAHGCAIENNKENTNVTE